MTITLVRIDDRVIHGQTTTRWTKARNVFGVLVVGDNIASDELRKKVLRAAAGNLKLGVYSEEVAPEKIAKAIEGPKDYFLISDSPKTFANLLRAGVDFGKTLNVGPMNTRPGTKVLGRTVALDQEDYEAFDYIYNQGVDVQFQLLPDDDIKNWPTMKKKYDSMS